MYMKMIDFAFAPKWGDFGARGLLDDDSAALTRLRRSANASQPMPQEADLSQSRRESGWKPEGIMGVAPGLLECRMRKSECRKEPEIISTFGFPHSGFIELNTDIETRRSGRAIGTGW